MRLHVSHQQSQFVPILARFMDYYLLIWGPKAISMVVEPHVVLTCWSSRLAVWASSGLFLGLLLTILGSRSDIHGRRTPGCVYVSAVNTRNFNRFWSVSCTITHRLGVLERFS